MRIMKLLSIIAIGAVVSCGLAGCSAFSTAKETPTEIDVAGTGEAQEWELEDNDVYIEDMESPAAGTDVGAADPQAGSVGSGNAKAGGTDPGDNVKPAEGDDSGMEAVWTVDERILALVSSEEYKACDKAGRYELAAALLKELEGEGLVKNVGYDIDLSNSTDVGLIGFEYANGVLGGIQLLDFSERDAAVGLPMD